MYYIGTIPVVESDIRHYGVPGMKWGDRKYQNEDGSLTPEGKARYGVGLGLERVKNVAKASGKTAASLAIGGTAGHFIGKRIRQAIVRSRTPRIAGTVTKNINGSLFNRLKYRPSVKAPTALGGSVPAIRTGSSRAKKILIAAAAVTTAAIVAKHIATKRGQQKANQILNKSASAKKNSKPKELQTVKAAMTNSFGMNNGSSRNNQRTQLNLGNKKHNSDFNKAYGKAVDRVNAGLSSFNDAWGRSHGNNFNDPSYERAVINWREKELWKELRKMGYK